MTQTAYNVSENIDNWKKIFKTGAVTAIVVISLIPVQMFVFTAYPPPLTAEGFLELFHNNAFLGFLSLDIIYTLSNLLLVLVYLALFGALRKTDFSLMLMAIIVGFIGIASYFSSTIAFEMNILSRDFFAAETSELKSQISAAAQALLVRYKGTAFVVYYFANGFTLLLISRVMLKDQTFSRATAVWGLCSGFLMLIPSTFGTVGLIFSIASLIPWIVFSILFARRLLRLSK